jgi:hypothetical protein
MGEIMSYVSTRLLAFLFLSGFNRCGNGVVVQSRQQMQIFKRSIKTNNLKMKGPWGKMARHNGIGDQSVDMTDKSF